MPAAVVTPLHSVIQGHNFLSSYGSTIPQGFVIARQKVKLVGMGMGGFQSQAEGCIIHFH